MNKPRSTARVTIEVMSASLLAATMMTLVPVNYVLAADPAHRGEIDILSVSHGVIIDEDSESAEQSSVAEAEVENSLSLEVEQGESPTLDRSHSITFGDR